MAGRTEEGQRRVWDQAKSWNKLLTLLSGKVVNRRTKMVVGRRPGMHEAVDQSAGQHRQAPGNK